MARFITNQGGVTHSVTQAEFERLTHVSGFRAATQEEIALWHEGQDLPVPPSELLPHSPSDEPVVEPVLPTGGSETNNLAASLGDATTAPAQANFPRADTGDVSSTGDANKNNSPTQQPAPDKPGRAPAGARKSRRRNSV